MRTGSPVGRTHFNQNESTLDVDLQAALRPKAIFYIWFLPQQNVKLSALSSQSGNVVMLYINEETGFF